MTGSAIELLGILCCLALATGLHWAYAFRDRSLRARSIVSALMTKSLTGVTYPPWGVLLLALGVDGLALILLSRWLGWLS